MTITKKEIAEYRKNYSIETMKYFAEQKDIDPVMSTRAIENAFSVAVKEITDFYISGDEEITSDLFKLWTDELRTEFNNAYTTLWED